MRIVRHLLRRVGGEIPGQVANRASTWRERHGVLLELEDESGVCGVGEASPLPGYSPDTLEACEAALVAWGARVPIGIGEDAPPLERVEAAAASLPDEAPAARMAVETALLDLIGKRSGVPVSELLAGCRPTAAIPLCALLSGADGAARAAEVREGLARGVRCFKLKVGGTDFDGELEAIRVLRRACPGPWLLRLDANGAWPPERARRNLAALSGLGIELVEQPVAPDALFDLTGSPVLLAADETMRLPDAVERLRASRACAAVVLKPMVLGGLVRCLRLGRRAREARLGVVVTHLFDGPVALAAACELALALATPLPCGLAPHPALAAYGPALPAALRADRISPHGLPGLGLADVS